MTGSNFKAGPVSPRNTGAKDPKIDRDNVSSGHLGGLYLFAVGGESGVRAVAS